MESALASIQRLIAEASDRIGRDRPFTLAVVTRGAGPADLPGDADLAHAPVTGMILAAAREYPRWKLLHADLPARPSEADGLALAAALRRLAPGEEQVAIRDGKARVPRLVASEDPNESTPAPLRADATYLVTGGTRGLGLHTARWLAARGARHLALAGRSAPTGPEAEAIDAIRAGGCEVRTYAADLAAEDGVDSLLSRISAELPPLRGLVHAAGHLEDAPLASLTAGSWKRVLAAKAVAAWRLHRATADRPLDFFVLYSSAASILGNAGQANYASANAFLDALAATRRRLGLPALSVNWGPWAEIGMAARTGAAAAMRAQGIRPIPPDLGMAALERLMGGSAAGGLVLSMDGAGQSAAPVPRGLLEELAGTARSPSGADRTPGREGLPDIASLPQAEAMTLIGKYFRGRILETTVLDTSLWDQGGKAFEEAQLSELGLDSLKAMELRDSIRDDLQVVLPLTSLLGDKQVRDLVALLYEKLLLRSLSSGETKLEQAMETEIETLVI